MNVRIVFDNGREAHYYGLTPGDFPWPDVGMAIKLNQLSASGVDQWSGVVAGVREEKDTLIIEVVAS